MADASHETMKARDIKTARRNTDISFFMVAPCGVYKKINIASRSKEIFEVFLLLKKYHKAFYGKYELAGKGVGQISRNRMGSFTGNLTKAEFDALRSQIATSNGKGGRRYRPYIFTEQGIAMLSGVLRSDVAVQMSIRIMNAFVEMRRFGISLMKDNEIVIELLNRLKTI